MAFVGIFETTGEYDTEIAELRTILKNAAGAEKFRLNTSQSDQQVTMNMAQIRAYLNQLITERASLIQWLSGAGVTSVTVRRSL